MSRFPLGCALLLTGCLKAVEDPGKGSETGEPEDSGLSSVDADDDGYAAGQGGGKDCDDGDAAVHPGADERCDGVDNDCDDQVDEDDAVDAVVWHADYDGDGFGDDLATVRACRPPTDYIEDATDCDDTDRAVYPGAVEVCDDVDNDCDEGTGPDLFVPTDYDTIGEALGDAGTGEWVCVLSGVYAERVVLNREVRLEGEDRASTIIDAQREGRPLTVLGVGAGAKVVGFTLKGGAGEQAAALSVEDSEVTLRNLVVQGNEASSETLCVGAIVSVLGGAPSLDGVLVVGNTATCGTPWGLVTLQRTTGTVNFKHFDLRDNLVVAEATAYGGLVLYDGVELDLENGILAGNEVSAGTTGSVWITSTAASVLGSSSLHGTNITVTGNVGQAGAGTVRSSVHVEDGSDATLVNVSISDNTAVASASVMAGLEASSSTTLAFCNLYDNDGGDISGLDDPVGSDGNIAEPPRFASVSGDARDWDLTLTGSSPLVDLGDPNIHDADGSRSDIGAFGGPGSDGW